MAAFKTAFDMVVLGLLGLLVLGPLGLMLGLIVAALLAVARAMKPARVKPSGPKQNWLENVFDRVLGKP